MNENTYNYYCVAVQNVSYKKKKKIIIKKKIVKLKHNHVYQL
jgi:hypothetical protein